MLKFLLIASLIFIATLADSEDGEELATVELNMNTFNELSAYIDIYNDEISAEMSKTCKQISKRKACLNAYSKAPVGIVTGRRGNDAPGECMYFKRKNNAVVKALGNQCLPANEVVQYMQANKPITSVQGSDQEDDADFVEMSEQLFDKISANAPSPDDIDEEAMMKYCKDINKENICLRSTSKAPVGRVTGRRGNDGPGECMYFQRKNNPVVKALGNQCLPPLSVIKYKQKGPSVEAVYDESEYDEELPTVEINMDTFNELASYINTYDDAISAEMSKTCKQISKRKACLNAYSKAPVGIVTGRRGNDAPGECMYFKRKNNKVAMALGNQCLPANEVVQYIQANKPIYSVQGEDEEDDADFVEMSEEMFDRISANAPLQVDIDDEEMMKYCKDINKEKICLKSTSKAPVGRVTGRRGNDGPGECMYFQRKNNPVVQALGNQCLPPLSVIKYKQKGRVIEAFFDESQDGEELATVELNMNTFNELSAYIDIYNDEISSEMSKTCKQISKRKACLNAYSKAAVGIVTGRRGNDAPGECMYFKRKNNAVVKALGNQCLPANEVVQYMQGNKPIISIQEADEQDDADAVEMSEGLFFDRISTNAPSQFDIDDQEMMKYCKDINKEKICLRSTSKAPVGRVTGRRGNDGPGECMYFQRKNNPVVQALGNQCLPPLSVIKYKQKGRAIEAFFDELEDDEELATVELNMDTFNELSAYIDIYDDAIAAEMSKTCKQISKRKACLNAYSKAPVGIVTGRRGNDAPGECMYFRRKNNAVVKALGNKCLPANEVVQYMQGNKPIISVQEADEQDDADAVEISEGLFDRISTNAASQRDIDDEEMMKYCKDINKEKICLRSTSKAPVGRVTGRRGNDGPGECMYFQRKNNPVVQALGNQCLPPLSVIKYKQRAVEDDEDDINSVEISMQTWDTLSLYINDADISTDARTIVGCETIKARRECINKGVTPRAPGGMDTGRRGNDSPGECMWFQKRNNPVVVALGSRCLAPAAVKKYKKSLPKYQVSTYISIEDTDYNDGLDLIEIDSIEMDEGLYDVLSEYAPNEDDIGLLDAETRGQIIGCKTITSKRECINKGVTSKAPDGENTGRRGNDAPGECMYFNRINNPIVQALGNKCLAPAAVRSYKEKMQNPPLDPEDDTEGLPTVELTMDTFSELAPYINTYDDAISAEMSKTCKQITKKKACLNAYSKAPVGIVTGRRGNDGPGECMYFQRKNNKVVRALGNQCLPANEVVQYIQGNKPIYSVQDEDEDEEDNVVEITEVLFSLISYNAPDATSDDIDDDAMMKYCKDIKKEKTCLRSTSKAPIGRVTGRRGNDGPGECMYFKRFNNPVVQALGNRCLAPKPVIAFVKANKPGLEMEFFAALGLIDEESQEINYDVLSIIFVMMIIIGFTFYYKLCRKNNDKYEPINDGIDARYYQSV